jgi:hypothetical protein
MKGNTIGFLVSLFFVLGCSVGIGVLTWYKFDTNKMYETGTCVVQNQTQWNICNTTMANMTTNINVNVTVNINATVVSNTTIAPTEVSNTTMFPTAESNDTMLPTAAPGNATMMKRMYDFVYSIVKRGSSTSSGGRSSASSSASSGSRASSSASSGSKTYTTSNGRTYTSTGTAAGARATATTVNGRSYNAASATSRSYTNTNGRTYTRTQVRSTSTSYYYTNSYSVYHWGGSPYYDSYYTNTLLMVMIMNQHSGYYYGNPYGSAWGTRYFSAEGVETPNTPRQSCNQALLVFEYDSDMSDTSKSSFAMDCAQFGDDSDSIKGCVEEYKTGSILECYKWTGTTNAIAFEPPEFEGGAIVGMVFLVIGLALALVFMIFFASYMCNDCSRQSKSNEIEMPRRRKRSARNTL